GPQPLGLERGRDWPGAPGVRTVEGGDGGVAAPSPGAPAARGCRGHPRWSRPDDPGWQGRLRGSPPLPLRGERRGAEEDARTAAAAPRVARDDRSATGWAGGSGKRRRLGRCTVSPTFRRLALFVLPAWLLAGCATTYLNRAPPSPSEPVIPAS